MPIAVLEDDDGVIDDPAHGDRQASQRQDVEREATDRGAEQRHQDAGRQGYGGDQGCPDAAQEKEDRENRKQRAQKTFEKEIVERRADPGGAVLDERQPVTGVEVQRGDPRMDVVRQADGVTVRIANHLNAEGGKPIGSGDAVHRRGGLLHGGDIA